MQKPLIIIRPGPTGARAGLADGPDVWEIVRDVQAAQQAEEADPVGIVRQVSGLRREQVEIALAYYVAHRDEVDARIRMNEEAATALRSSQAGAEGGSGPLP
jgi:hypothetical protein